MKITELLESEVFSFYISSNSIHKPFTFHLISFRLEPKNKTEWKSEWRVLPGCLGRQPTREKSLSNFFKTDWKLLNDPTLLGAVEANAGKVRGVLIPVGMKEVYEGAYDGMGSGEKITVPFLQCKYRVAGAENRKYKTWLTGTVGGVYTNDNDSMEVHHLSERVLCTTGANNFMIFEGN